MYIRKKLSRFVLSLVDTEIANLWKTVSARYEIYFYLAPMKWLDCNMETCNCCAHKS